MEKYKVIRDTREQQGWIFDESDTCLGTSIATLKTGDYTLEGYEHKFIIERKGTVGEFVGNLVVQDNWSAFKKELYRLDEFQYAFIICEFPFSLIASYPKNSGLPMRVQEKIKVKPQFILKRVEEIFIHFKTKFIFTGNKDLGKSLASGLFKRMVENVKPE